MEIEDIIALAITVSEMLDIRLTDIQALRESIAASVPIPMVYNNDEHTLWVDRHYIAVSAVNSFDVLYIFVTRFQAKSELRDIKGMMKNPKLCERFALFTSITRQMVEALKTMRATESEFFLMGDYKERIMKLSDLDGQIRRGDIYYANLNPVVGSEQGDSRPVLVVQNDMGNKYSPTIIVVPVTKNLHKNPLPTHVKLSRNCGLGADSLALMEQIRVIDRSRLREYIGRVSKDILPMVDKALIVSVGIRYFDEYKPAMCHVCEVVTGMSNKQ